MIYDPEKTSYYELVLLFLRQHNPSFEVPFYRGGQYRTSILFSGPGQEEEAKRALKDFGTRSKRAIHTYLEPAGTWWRAEEYHQKYYEKHRVNFCR